MPKLIIANMMRCKNKQSFFALHQIQHKIHALYPEVEIEFHILWDTDESIPEKQDDATWGPRIDAHFPNIVPYTRQFFKQYVQDAYAITDVQRFDDWLPSYHILMAHYLRRVKLYDYYLIYDDDILINDDFKVVTDLLLQKVPVLISEPMNAGCDKALAGKLTSIYGAEFVQRYNGRNPKKMGFNAGFQGITLTIIDDYLSADRFAILLSLFKMRTALNPDGTELWGHQRFLLDTQQQSFFGLMNMVVSEKTPHILDPDEYYVVPDWGRHPVHGEIKGWDLCLSSRISHFIGHTHGKGKPKVFLDKVDAYIAAHFPEWA